MRLVPLPSKVRRGDVCYLDPSQVALVKPAAGDLEASVVVLLSGAEALVDARPNAVVGALAG
jgi:hypothetical protein